MQRAWWTCARWARDRCIYAERVACLNACLPEVSDLRVQHTYTHASHMRAAWIPHGIRSIARAFHARARRICILHSLSLPIVLNWKCIQAAPAVLGVVNEGHTEHGSTCHTTHGWLQYGLCVLAPENGPNKSFNLIGNIHNWTMCDARRVEWFVCSLNNRIRAQSETVIPIRARACRWVTKILQLHDVLGANGQASAIMEIIASHQNYAA